MIPRGAVGAAIVPTIEVFGRRAKQLEGLKSAAFAAQLQGFGNPAAMGDAFFGQLGIDLRSQEALEKAGLDAKGSMAVVGLVSAQFILVLPVKDERKFHATIGGLASRRLGLNAGSETRANELTVKTFSERQGMPPRLGYVLSRGYGLVARDEGIASLPSLAQLRDSDALATDEVYAKHRARVPAGDTLVFLPVGSPALARSPATSLFASMSLTPSALTFDVDAPWKDLKQLEVLEPKKGADLLGLMPKDAFLLVRLRSDVALLAPYVDELLGPHLTAAFRDSAFDVKKEVLGQLLPGAVAALSLADRPPMDRGLPNIDIRRTNPFTYVHLSGAAEAKTADTIWPTLEKIAAVAPKFGAVMQRGDRNGHAVMLTSYAQGEGIHFSAKDHRVFFASPVARMDALFSGEGRTAAATPQGFGGGAVEVALDLKTLAQSVRALPDTAWGLGGFAMKATALRWLDAVSDLTMLTLSETAKDGAVQVKFTLSLAPASTAVRP
jgi:hypothetical protein